MSADTILSILPDGFLLVIFLIGVYAEDKVKDIVLFSLCCLLQGAGYTLFFVARMGVWNFWSNVINIVNADKSHGSWKAGKFFSLFSDPVGLWLIGCLITAFMASVLLHYMKDDRVKQIILWILSLAVMILQLAQMIMYHQKFLYVAVYIVLLVFGTFGVKYCDVTEKMIYLVGLLLSLGSFFATALLTNLGLGTSAAYLIVAVMVSFVPVMRWMENKLNFDAKAFRWNILLWFCGFMVLCRGIAVMSLNGEAPTIFDLRGVMTAGPATGIVTDYMGMYETQCDMEDFGQYVVPGDRLLVVNDDLLHVLEYLYQDVVISAHSTICTPTFDEKILEYWNQNPEKAPSVIAVSCWYGELRISESSWIYRWIQEGF